MNPNPYCKKALGTLPLIGNRTETSAVPGCARIQSHHMGLHRRNATIRWIVIALWNDQLNRCTAPQLPLHSSQLLHLPLLYCVTGSVWEAGVPPLKTLPFRTNGVPHRHTLSTSHTVSQLPYLWVTAQHPDLYKTSVIIP